MMNPDQANAGFGWVMDAIYAIIAVGKIFWPDLELWDTIQGECEAADPRPKP